MLVGIILCIALLVSGVAESGSCGHVAQEIQTYKKIGITCAMFSTPADEFVGYAPPNAFGTWYSLRSHFGIATSTISYDTVGKSLVIGEIEYYSSDGKDVRKEFNGSVTVTTGNAYSTPRVRFKGIPLGSAVNVKVR